MRRRLLGQIPLLQFTYSAKDCLTYALSVSDSLGIHSSCLPHVRESIRSLPVQTFEVLIRIIAFKGK